MRRKKDEIYGKICQFFDTTERRCTIYHARPSTCRAFPGDGHCGYYDFLKFERDGQEDENLHLDDEPFRKLILSSSIPAIEKW